MLIWFIPLIYKISVPNAGTEGEDTTQHNLGRTLEREFNKIDRPRKIDTWMGIMQGTPGEGASTVGDPALQLLHKLWQSSPELVKEITKLQ